MAAVTFSGAAIVSVPASGLVRRTAGGTISKHDAVYIDTATNNVVKAAVNTAAASAVVYGIATHAAVSGEEILIAVNGATLTVGGGLTAKTEYYLGGTAGEIELLTDLTGGEYICRVGWSNSTTEFELDINNTGLTA